MKCLLDGSSVKVLARAIHSLAKIGDELHIEPTENGLTLKTVNSSKSAYSAFSFHVPFFLDYNHISENTVQQAADNEDETVIKCKLPMKSILSVFRSIGSLEKSVETCNIRLPLLEALLIIEFRCKHGIVKHFNLRYFECESVEAEFSKDGYSSKFCCSSRFYSDTLQSFHSSTPEVTWSLAMDQVHLSNHIDDELDPSKCVRTEVTLAKDEFIEFNVALCTQITFCLKELRAILAFAEALGLDLYCRMETAGQPVLFSLHKENLYSADFLLATLTPAIESTQSSSRPSVGTSQRANASNHPSPVPNLRNKTDSASVSRANFKDYSGVSHDNVKGSRNVSRAKDFSNVSRANLQNTSIPTTYQTDTPDHNRLNSLSLIEPHPFPDMDVDTDVETEIQPPPTKRARARYIFQRCLKPSQDTAPRKSEVYAPPSDSEED
uniref:Cell cycle checkpoint control protein n=1 Tax=Ceriodaphnia reticulata TaxID=302197 RepID=A0A4Y7LVY8_9CRUS|nr:EOG090X0A9P [Ceriodaphnia reticulata]